MTRSKQRTIDLQRYDYGVGHDGEPIYFEEENGIFVKFEDHDCREHALTGESAGVERGVTEYG